jgi:transposase
LPRPSSLAIQRARDLERDFEQRLESHEVGKLLTTITSLGPLTAACIIAEARRSLPVPKRGRACLRRSSASSPSVRQRRFSGRISIPLGNARLRRALWMPVLVAVRLNPWLRAHYWRPRHAGKPPKVAMIACMHKLLAAIYSVAKNRRPFVARVPIEPAGTRG